MKKQARDLKEGEKIKLAEKIFIITSIEISEIGKHGKSKVRIAAKTDQDEKIVIIRPDNYPVEAI